MFVQMVDRGSQHLGTMFACAVGLRADTEQSADIAKACCGKQCVNQRMCRNVAIRITLDAIAIPTQTGKPQRLACITGCESMRVKTLTDTHENALLLLGLLAFGFNSSQRIHSSFLRSLGMMLLIARLSGLISEVHIQQTLGFGFIKLFR